MPTTHTLRAAALLSSSTASQIPVVPTVTCARCARLIGTGSIQYAIGRCVCGTPFPAPGPAVCAACGVLESRHRDGVDGSPLDCAEASRRWGGTAA